MATKKKIKSETTKILNSLGLSWGAFVNNAARELITKQKIIFKVRDSAGFTKAKAKELKKIGTEAKLNKNISPKMNLTQAKNYLSKF